jgi:hypothetical protein
MEEYLCERERERFLLYLNGNMKDLLFPEYRNKYAGGQGGPGLLFPRKL